MSKTKEDIEREYVNLCSQLGETEYRASVVKEELTRLNNQKNTLTQGIQKLAKEHTKAQAALVEAKTPEQLTQDLGLNVEEPNGNIAAQEASET